MTLHKGSCHCGAVKYEVEAPSDMNGLRCNCSICKSVGYIHLIVEKDAFKLISGADDITTYTFNTHVAKHTFCKHCGIKSFYTPRSHPNGISVNINTIDPQTITSIQFVDFDGDNWERNIEKIR